MKLLPYESGDPPPVFVEAEEQHTGGARGGRKPAGRGRAEQADDDDDDETVQEAEVDCHGHAAPRDALDCVAALALTREGRQNCVRFAFRGPHVDRLHVLELERNVE